MRFLFEVSYKGTNYNGWQIQKNAHSVQAELNNAFSTIIKQEINIVGSGRTDTGVHALQQFFHIDLTKPPGKDLINQLNGLLPRDIAILSVKEIKKDASARFSARWRSYEYRIHGKKDPFAEGLSYFYARPLNVDVMNEGAQLLFGEKDFKAFSKVKTDTKHFKCNVKAAYFHEENNRLTFYVTANRFLRGMVRALVGSLLLLGEQKIDVKKFKEIITGKDRRKAGPNLPPHGLFLSKVEYPDHIFV